MRWNQISCPKDCPWKQKHRHLLKLYLSGRIGKKEYLGFF